MLRRPSAGRQPATLFLHTEGAGRPHCVGVRFSSDLDGNMLRQLSTSFRHAYEKAIDKGTVVSFWQRAAHDEVGLVGDLLDVCAGSGNSGSSSSDGEQQGPKRVAPLYSDEEMGLALKDNILKAMHGVRGEEGYGEPESFIRREDGRRVCPFCPFRSLVELRYLRHHMGRHHSREKQYVASGTKQIKTIPALHDFAASVKMPETEYLMKNAKNAQLLRQSLKPPISCSINLVDKAIRLCFTAGGPVYVNATAVKDLALRKSS